VLKYVTVKFEGVDGAPFRLSSLRLRQARYEHDLMFMTFREWDASFDLIKPGTPVSVLIKDLENPIDFYGYVHHLEPNKTPGSDNVTVAVIGASFVFKQPSQAIYRNITASALAIKLASKYNFSYYVTPHPRVFPQIAQSGQSDWQLLVRLARQCGYSLKAENTELYFQPLTENFTRYKSEAKRFYMNDANDPSGSTIYSFSPLVGETLAFDDGTKSATAVTGIDLVNDSSSIFNVTKQKQETSLRKKYQQSFFDSFQSGTTAIDFSSASYEAAAADLLTMFPYRAQVEVLGNTELKPTMPIYLEGLSTDYSGYWIVLETEHLITNAVYTTKLTAGIDSLGSANVWTDGVSLETPPNPELRTIIPSEIRSSTKPETILNVAKVGNNPSSKYLINATKNRSQTDDYSINKANWISKGKRDLNATITKNPLPGVVYEKLRLQGAL
jgi:hypothetical protein